MTKPRKKRGSVSRERNIQIRSVRRNPPDVEKLSRALLAIAVGMAQAEKDAQAEATAKEASDDKS